MTPVVTLYILGGCVAFALGLFIIMLVVSALRAPDLPPLTSFQPLERMIRALTPPVGLPAVAMPVTIRVAEPRPVVRLARVADEMPTAPERPDEMPTVPFNRAAAVAAMPTVAAPVWTGPAWPQPAQPVIVPPPMFNPPRFAARAVRLDLGKDIRRPTLPEPRPRKLLRVFVALFVAHVVLAGAVVAYPAMIDPLCDDYEWFGSDSASVVRDYAWQANEVIGAPYLVKD